MTYIKEENDLERIRDCGRLLREVFRRLDANIGAGMSTLEIDREVEEMIVEGGGIPAFKGYKGFPAAICASVNEVVVHGIPSDKVILKDGDIVAIDIGVKKNGFYTDAAKTYAIGKVSDGAASLIKAAEEALREGIKKAVTGNRVSDISGAIENTIKKAGYMEVRAFVGHGVGRSLHEDPEVPNWKTKRPGMIMKEGLVLAIEPMVNAGGREVKVSRDNWMTAVTADGGLSAHFEHTVIVGREKAEELT